MVLTNRCKVTQKKIKYHVGRCYWIRGIRLGRKHYFSDNKLQEMAHIRTAGRSVTSDCKKHLSLKLPTIFDNN